MTGFGPKGQGFVNVKTETETSEATMRQVAILLYELYER